MKRISIKENRTVRIFFAIWPDEAVRKQLAHLAKRSVLISGGRGVKIEAIHLTLVFLGEVNVNRVDDLCSIAKGVIAKSFDFSIDEIYYWKQNRIICAGMKQYSPELLILVDSLRNVLSDAGFLFDRRDYRPHITLVRRAVYPVEYNLTRPISWRIHEWTLMQSKQTDSGVYYIPLDRWSLR
ncbi:2'-5' RNA ligase [Nitrosomonas cryotolerans]|uniref:RNA 2',3'-cyclic phosphodiesterase n=1 Tax=Nitrosomonas cryotolerans ATCC 49181 TaxID=1131553 RepID=A0A1N6H7P5_9PROT|nr:2'-5' RNA ligase [Nitrosomonas cryotolerans]SIO15705.1 2'-5' RNA ligase [Nitrosomonas cryotolerans ATCC 49181]